jgi:hypothetical protein
MNLLVFQKKKYKKLKSQEDLNLNIEELKMSPVKKKKRNRHSVMVENSIKIKADNAPKKKKKKESIDETVFQKTNINNIDQKPFKGNIDKEIKKTAKIQPKEETKENIQKKEEKKEIDNVKASISTRKRLPSYYEKYPKKPKQSFYSTSKNPKINQILNKLRQNGEIKLKDDTKEVGKIASDKIGKYNRIVGQQEYKWGNKSKGIAPKIKDYLDKMNSSGVNSSMVSNNQLPSITETSKKQYANTEGNIEENEDEDQNNKDKKKKKKKKKKRKHKKMDTDNQDESLGVPKKKIK